MGKELTNEHGVAVMHLDNDPPSGPFTSPDELAHGSRPSVPRATTKMYASPPGRTTATVRAEMIPSADSDFGAPLTVEIAAEVAELHRLRAEVADRAERNRELTLALCKEQLISRQALDSVVLLSRELEIQRGLVARLRRRSAPSTTLQVTSLCCELHDRECEIAAMRQVEEFDLSDTTEMPAVRVIDAQCREVVA